ncbi:MAG: hypothetical protein HZA90_17280 [Verrucomicrobia bacterium]|nr:hypothetical protein [Verrucomicrobiota bacterium]
MRRSLENLRRIPVLLAFVITPALAEAAQAHRPEMAAPEKAPTTNASASSRKQQWAFTLESIRQSVAANEKLLNPIRLRFTNTFERKGESLRPSSGMRQPGRRYSHLGCEWAQKGDRHYARLQYFFSPEEVAQNRVYVIDETNWWSAGLPDLTQPSKSLRENLKWNAEIGVTVLGLRPFEGDYSMSEILQPPWATFSGQTEEVDGKRSAVVEVKRRVLNPDHPAYYGRFWIDVERGVVLRIRYFDGDAANRDRRHIGTIDELRHLRLANGAWLPVEGRRTTGFPDRLFIEHIRVAKESITIKSAEIPDSLFTIESALDAPLGDRPAAKDDPQSPNRTR